LKQGAPYGYIRKFLEGKYEMFFDGKEKASRYIRNIVNKYLFNCILCGEPRYCTKVFTLYCKAHFEEWNRLNKLAYESWEKELLKEMEENPGYWNDSFGTHGDMTDKTMGIHNKLGTSKLGPHRNKNYKSESTIIKHELKKLGLRSYEKEGKSRKEIEA